MFHSWAVLIRSVCGTLVLFSSSTILAQTFPTRPVTVVSAFSVGSGADLAARAAAGALEEALGTTVIVENRAGAGGAIGARLVAKAKPDGYTLLSASISFAMMASMTDPGFDAYKDFVPIMMFGTQQLFFVAQPSLPVSSLKELVEFARAKPGQLNYGSSGIGSMQHFQTELLKSEAGLDIVHVPYKGTPEIITDLVAERVQFSVIPVSVALPLIRSGKIKALSVQGPGRTPELPNVPTTAESGYPNVGDGGWYVLMAPTGTPSEIITKLNSAFKSSLTSPRAIKLFGTAGLIPAGSTPEEASAFLKNQLNKWKSVALQAKIVLP